MILELDIGNTNAKWRLLGEQSEALASGIRSTTDSLAMLSALDARPGRVRISSVAGEKIDQPIASWIEEHWSVVPEFAATLRQFGGITIAYEDPSRLGVDRWLAMQSAFAEFGGPVCVMDLGSAVTIDLINAAGQHLGGYIVPGVRLQERALLNDTGLIRIEQRIAAGHTGWGKSSEECITQGVYRMLLAFIDSILDELEADVRDVSICVTGGNAALMSQSRRESISVMARPELVLDGLAVALP